MIGKRFQIQWACLPFFKNMEMANNSYEHGFTTFMKVLGRRHCFEHGYKLSLWFLKKTTGLSFIKWVKNGLLV